MFLERCAGGEHAASRLAARALAACLPGAASVLDVGCGDGFLLGVARRAGVARVVGIERDPAAAAGARAVAGAEVLEGDLFTLEPGRFDVVVANLHDPLLFEALPRLVRWTGRALVAGGVRLHRGPALVRALARHGLAVRPPEALDGWCAACGAWPQRAS